LSDERKIDNLLIVENTIEKSVKFRMKRRRDEGWKKEGIKTKKTGF